MSARPVIAPLLDQWFIDNREEREPDGKLHPSSMAGCWRQAVYEATGTPRSDGKDVRTFRIMWFGTALHELLQEAIAGKLTDFEDEVVVEPEGWPLSGSSDGVYLVEEDGDGGIEELLEFKSIDPNQLRRKDFRPKVEHVEQARMYWWGLTKQGRKIAYIRVCYISRNDMAMREYVIDPPDRAWIDAFEDKLRLSERLHLGEGATLLPPRLPSGSWLCGYCVYQTRCWEQDDADRRND